MTRMNLPARYARNAFASGSAASLLSAWVLTRRGRSEAGSAAAPINAVSHWLHGDAAYSVDAPDVRHTALGLVVHHASAVFWGVLYEAVLRRIGQSANRSPKTAVGPRPSAVAGASAELQPGGAAHGRPTPGEVLAGAAVVTAVAALTDLRLVPPRLSPGFEHRLRAPSVVLVYVAFAAGLAMGAAALRRH
jgi:hypothetical protein